MKRLSLLAALAPVAVLVGSGGAEAGDGRRGRRLQVGVRLHQGSPFRRGRTVWRNERIWVPGRYKLRWVQRREPDRFAWRTVQVPEPDRFEWRTERVWVPGRVVCREERCLLAPGRWQIRPCPGGIPSFRRVWLPPRYGTRAVRVEAPGHWEVRRERVRIPGGWTTRRERVRIPGAVCRVQERVWCPAHYETRRVEIWVPGAAYVPRTSFVIGGNHGGFGFSLILSRR